MIIGIEFSKFNCRPGRDKLQKYNTKAIDITEWGQVEAGAIGGVKVSRSSFDLAADV